MLKVIDYYSNTLYTFNMKRGNRYIGIINGKRYWKALVCGHAVPMYNTKRCKECWFKSDEYKTAITKPKKSSVSGKKHHSWKGGRIIDGGGYIKIRVEKKYVFEHRYIMEKYLGRKLQKNEEVHHINHNKTDNRIDNLMLFSNHTEHLIYEHKERKTKK